MEIVFVEISEVGWDDPRAVALRDEMDRWLHARYAGAPPLSASERAALSLDPADVVVTLLATADGRPAGHGALRRLGAEIEVKRLVVAEGARGRGVAAAVMAGLEERARALGATRLVLNTGDRQHEAMALYEKLGYAAIDNYPPYDAVPFSRSYAKEI